MMAYYTAIKSHVFEEQLMTHGKCSLQNVKWKKQTQSKLHNSRCNVIY